MLFQGDATKLDKVPDHSIDVVLIDPPYGINYVTGHRKVSLSSAVRTNERFSQIANDAKFPTKMLNNCFWEIARILKPDTALYVFTRWDVQDRVIALMTDLFNVRNQLVWVKNNWTAGDLEGNYAYQTENIIYATKGNHKLIGTRPTNALFYKRVEGKQLVHPAQKPTPLLSFLISKSCPKDGVVLDCFMGCGSTCVAASQMGVRSIGIDLDPKNVELAQKRLQQGDMFAESELERIQNNFEVEFE
jgi:site-specific DNA-methyltransferase (adenine-specific)